MGRTPEPRETDVVRLAPDYADTVIWFSGFVPYDEAQISADLVAAMQAWERFFYDHESAKPYVVDKASMPHYREEGIRLARWLAKEIGPQFVVEFESDESTPAPRRFRSAEPALNPAAARAFTARAAEDDPGDGAGSGTWTIAFGR